MKIRVIITLIIIFSLFYVHTVVASAHPIDQSLTELYLKKSFDNESIDSSKIQGAMYSSWFQISWIADLSVDEEITPELFDTNKDKIFKYLTDNLLIKNNDKECKIKGVSIDFRESGAALINTAVKTDFVVECVSEINLLGIENNLFLNIAPTQRNDLLIKEGQDKVIALKLLSSSNNETTVDINNPDNDIKDSKDDNNNSSTGANFNSNSTLFNKITNNIPEILNADSGVAVGFIIAVAILIGALHTFEAGHSKVILATIMVDNKVRLFEGLVYVLVFTISHMSDIFIVGTLLLIVEQLGDIYETLTLLQAFSVYAFLGITIVMFFKAISELLANIIKKDDHSHQHDHSLDLQNKSIKDYLLIAFVTGLSPCLMAWSLLMLIITSKKLWLIFPVMISFGLGIFFVELIFMYLIYKFRTKLNSKISFVVKYSKLISSTVLLMIAISFVI